jgi:hypothetical protein
MLCMEKSIETETIEKSLETMEKSMNTMKNQ